MSLDGTAEQRRPPPQMPTTGNGNCVNIPSITNRLSLNANKEHKAESYEDVPQLEFTPLLFSSLERYLPSALLRGSRVLKLQFMRDILQRYSSDSERIRVKRHQDYRLKIISNYQPRNKELYNLEAEEFFVPSFLRAINEKTEDSFRSIMAEPSPGVFTFEMLQPQFCELLFI